ncbi:MAG TPA: HAMP domain-containing sensor histidine kinase [Symbiobacteriaceae bacterium]|nr:HAMP domain-containing sensor histidine kinase [Symbiobacteriaceae bacterium]
MKWIKSLRVRLIGTYVVLALVLLGTTGLVFSNAFADYAGRVYQQRIREMMGQAIRVAQESQDPPEQLVERLNRLFPELEVAYVPAVIGVRVVPPGALDTPVPSLFTFRKGGLSAVDPAVPLLIPGKSAGQLVFRPKAAAPNVFGTLYREVALLLALGLGVAALLGWWLSRWLARPIAGLTEATAAVAEGDFMTTVPPTGTPELDGLVQQFNRMAVRLSESFRSLAAERDTARRFASDAAHELKTPLTALKAYHETAVDRPERVAHALPGMGRQIARLERVIAGLLQLARLSEGTGFALEDSDLGDLLQEMKPSLGAMAADYQQHLRVTEPSAPVPVRVDARLLEMALVNLVENACKFTPPGGEVRVDLARTEHEAVLTVADTGPGIAPEELPHIFSRFYRGVQTQAIPGSGLGLSIVHEAATRMGGRVTVETELGQGSTFRLHLPILI